MKKFLIALFLISNSSFGQPCEERKIQLRASNPEPRVGDHIEITLDLDPIRKLILNSEPGYKMEDDMLNYPDGYPIVTKKLGNTGKFDVGPFEFTLNNIRFTSNKLKYQVIDSLPPTDDGLWIRAVKTSDSVFALIIEQRFPSLYKPETTDRYVIDQKKFTRFIKPCFEPGALLMMTGSSASSSRKSLHINGEIKYYDESYSIMYLNIPDRSKKIVLTREDFQNIPAGYDFKDIVIQ